MTTLTRVYIPSDLVLQLSDKELFILVRPFKGDKQWENNNKRLQRWGISGGEFEYTPDIREADLMLLPFTINRYVKFGYLNKLKEYNKWCEENRLRAYGYISGDYGEVFPEFRFITYFRMGGFKSKLSSVNKGFPFSLSDQYEKITGRKEIAVRDKAKNPTIGFCGHASLSPVKKYKELLGRIRENGRRWLSNPTRKDWEPLFPSAFNRAKVLKSLEQHQGIKTNFIYRMQYRAGAYSAFQLQKTTHEYYENMLDSDYIVCIRGGGNFSVRLYETLMMGKIPVLINTDCLLPFENEIDWRNRMVWVEWENHQHVGDAIVDFHSRLTNKEFRALQESNRAIWKNELSIKGILRKLVQ